MYIRLVQSGHFLYQSLEEIQESINDEKFLSFNDSFLETAAKEYYDHTEDEEFKRLYEMFRDRIRPKVIFEMKDMYENSPSQEFSVLKYELQKNPDKISELIGTDRWGYQIAPLMIEKIHNSYKVADKQSVVNKLANYQTEFIRVYVLEEKGKKYDYERMHNEIKEMIS